MLRKRLRMCELETFKKSLHRLCLLLYFQFSVLDIATKNLMARNQCSRSEANASILRQDAVSQGFQPAPEGISTCEVQGE